MKSIIICRTTGFLQKGTVVLLMASLQISCEIGGIVPRNYSVVHCEFPVCIVQVLIYARILRQRCIQTELSFIVSVQYNS